MHLFPTDHPRIFASTDAILRWSHWFPVIADYLPPERSVGIVSGQDYDPHFVPQPVRSFRGILQSRQQRLCSEFSRFSHACITSRQHEPRQVSGRHCYSPNLKFSMLLVNPTTARYRNDLTLLHEMGHATDLLESHYWPEKARSEILAEAFSYAVYGQHVKDAAYDIALEDADVTARIYCAKNKADIIHFPGSGPYLQAAQEKGQSLVNMQGSYFRLHTALQAALGHRPRAERDLLRAVSHVLEKEPECSPVYPYAVHLRDTQRRAMGIA